MKKLLQKTLYEIDDSILTATEEERSRLDMPFRRKNIYFLFVLTAIFFLIFFTRIFYLTVVRGDHYNEVSRKNFIRTIPIEAPRGKIFDRKNKQLVFNIPSTDLVIRVGEDIAQTDTSLYFGLTSLFDLSEEELQTKIEYAKKTSYTEVLLKENIAREEILRFSERETEFPGISLKNTVSRRYEESSIFSHIIGYENSLTAEDIPLYPHYLLTDSLGRQGLEKEYENYLRGKHGARRIEVDALGRVRREISSQPPVLGNDLFLSLDGDLQKVLFESMKEELEKNGLSRGAAVAMNPKNGEILALVSFPSYDNNIFSDRNNALYPLISQDVHQPLFNRVVSGKYPPASTIKSVLAVGALSEGVVSETTKIESKGGISLGSTFFGDWKVHGFTDIRRAIAVSSDVYFYSIGGGYGNIRGMGMDTMKKYENLFSFGEKTGIDLPGESPGLVPDSSWKEEVIGERWYIGNTYHASIGQGYMQSTPLQVTVATSIIANKGIRYDPKIVSHIRSSDGSIIYRAENNGRILPIERKILDIVGEGMRQTVTEGTAMMLNDLPVEVAGKTGTAEYGIEDKTHGWFTSFAPYQNPEIVLTVLIEAQENDGYHAVPITKKVYESYFSERK